jgi:hypothetical protein
LQKRDSEVLLLKKGGTSKFRPFISIFVLMKGAFYFSEAKSKRKKTKGEWQ